MKLINYTLTFIGLNILAYVYSFDNGSLPNNEQIEFKIRRFENNLEYAKILNENINFIDDVWKNHMLSIKRQLKNMSNKINDIENVIGSNTYAKLQQEHSPKILPSIIDKYYDIILQISKNEIFTNKILVNIQVDSDSEYIGQKIIQKIFYGSDIFNRNGLLITNLEKLKLIEITLGKTNNFDYDFFDKNYQMYGESMYLFLNKIYLFKLQNQNALKKMFESYSTDNYKSFEQNIINQVYGLTNVLIDKFEQNIN